MMPMSNLASLCRLYKKCYYKKSVRLAQVQNDVYIVSKVATCCSDDFMLMILLKNPLRNPFRLDPFS